ncbi:MAG: hypothetical protein AAFP80_02750 [Pseudomonadota bacterium]
MKSIATLKTKLTTGAFLVGTLMTVMWPNMAAAETLSGQALKDFVNGKRVYLRVPLGGEFPLFYQTNGRVTGDGSALGLGRYFAPKETGRWFVQGSKLCQQFPTWYKGEVSCFRIFKTGETTLRWTRDDGYSGRARIAG